MQPITILMLEDTAQDIELTRETLRQEKLMNRLLIASSIKQALELLRANAVDLMLVDIQLGCESGLDFIEEAKKQKLLGDSAIVVLSGSEDPQLQARADLLGVQAWVDKPLNISKLNYLARHVPELFMAVVMQPQAKKRAV